MKKLFPVALLLCLSISMSGFGPANSQPVTIQKSAFSIAFPVTGQAMSSLGLIDYSISGSGTTPYSISFYNGSTFVGSYPFIADGPNSNIAGGMKAATNINGVRFSVYAGTDNYEVDFYSPY